MKRLFTLILFALLSYNHSFAQLNASQEQRARDIGSQLRCVVCQNQSIEESQSDLAIDMKIIIRERIVAGEDNDEIIRYMQERYGDFVLLKPPFQTNTYLLWFGPAILLILLLIWFLSRKPKRGDPQLEYELSDLDQVLLDDLLADKS